MRTSISIILAIVLLLFVGYLAYSGSIVLPEYWTSLAVTLTAIALGILYWGFKPKIDRFFKEKRETQESKAETTPSLKVKKRKSALLPDDTQITKLNISDSLFDRIYQEAQQIATNLYHDAQLSRFTVQVYPFSKPAAKVNIYLDFYSKWADKICKFQYYEPTEELRHTTPDKGPLVDSDKEIFATLPWKMSPQWVQFLDRAYTKIRPVPSDENTKYHLSATPPMNWHVNFEDGFSGKEYAFEWNGKGLDENSVKQVR